MKIRFKPAASLKRMPKAGGVTVGYWRWTRKFNCGDLHIHYIKMKSWRFNLAVIGHELIEAFYCWIFMITTEECDAWDIAHSENTEDHAFDKECPYYWGHRFGTIFEYIFIYGSFGNWTKYDQECNKVMGISNA